MSTVITEPLSDDENSRLKRFYASFDKYGLSFVRTKPGGYVFPAAYSKHKDYFKNWKAEQDDLYVMAYPKNGTTWSQELVWCIKNGCNIEAARSTYLDERVPFMEAPVVLDVVAHNLPVSMEDLLTRIEKMPRPRILKCHLPFSLLPEDLLDISKVIVCLRNPKDTIVSFYHHERLFKQHSYVGDFNSYFDLFMDNLSMWSSYFNYVTEVWERRRHPNMCLLFFEEMAQDQASSIRKVAKFLGKSLTDSQVDALVDHLDFNKMKVNPAVNKEEYRQHSFNHKEGSFLRQGKVGGWKSYFSKEMNKRMDDVIQKYLTPIGLNFKYE